MRPCSSWRPGDEEPGGKRHKASLGLHHCNGKLTTRMQYHSLETHNTSSGDILQKTCTVQINSIGQPSSAAFRRVWLVKLRQTNDAVNRQRILRTFPRFLGLFADVFFCKTQATNSRPTECGESSSEGMLNHNRRDQSPSINTAAAAYDQIASTLRVHQSLPTRLYAASSSNNQPNPIIYDATSWSIMLSQKSPKFYISELTYMYIHGIEKFSTNTNINKFQRILKTSKQNRNLESLNSQRTFLQVLTPPIALEITI